MPWNYRIDKERRLIITTVWDKLSGAEVGEHQRKLLIDSGFEPEFFQFLDFADVVDFQIDRVTVASWRASSSSPPNHVELSLRQIHSPTGCRACLSRSAKLMAARSRSKCSRTATKLCSGLTLYRLIDHTVDRTEVEQDRIGQK